DIPSRGGGMPYAGWLPQLVPIIEHEPLWRTTLEAEQQSSNPYRIHRTAGCPPRSNYVVARPIHAPKRCNRGHDRGGSVARTLRRSWKLRPNKKEQRSHSVF
ncbi:MAG: hypothetical protein SNJ75_05540, partial [Gemmataceae bacterium]